MAVVQQVVQYFNSRGSSLYVPSLDSSKAFDRINHSKLVNKLIDHNVPTCLIMVIINWYGNLESSRLPYVGIAFSASHLQLTMVFVEAV